MRILLIEPFLTGSHRLWAEGLAAASRHTVRIAGLPGRYWKWRMQGSAEYFAARCGTDYEQPDLILATDMLDAAAFRGLVPLSWRRIPLAIYYHENQFAYPDAKRDWTYAHVNYRSALAAERLFFNSAWNRDSFLAGASDLLGRMPDCRPAAVAERLYSRSVVLPLGMDYAGLCRQPREPGPPVILWNHRWEADKGCEEFLSALHTLAAEEYRLLLFGEGAVDRDALSPMLRERIMDCGFVAERKAYRKAVGRADILPVAARQDFFGISVLEAVYAGVRPLLPERLVYPEHFPPSRFPEIYYRENFTEALRRALAGPLVQPSGLRERAAR